MLTSDRILEPETKEKLLAGGVIAAGLNGCRNCESIDIGRSREVSKTLAERTLSRSGEYSLGAVPPNEDSGRIGAAGRLLWYSVGEDLWNECWESWD